MRRKGGSTEGAARQRATAPAVALALGLSVGPDAHAGITAPVTLDFEGAPLTVFGEANQPLVAGACQGAGNCWFEDGFAVGVVTDPDDTGEHLHRAGGAGARQLRYEADSSGFYVRAVDGAAFSLVSLSFNAAITEVNPGTGADDVWEILGFNSAENPALGAGDGTNYPSRVAYQQVANGFNGTLALNADFRNIHAFWIHYKGFPGVPSPTAGKDFELLIDNVSLAPAVVPPASVPVPALGLWGLTAGLLSLAGIGARRRG